MAANKDVAKIGPDGKKHSQMWWNGFNAHGQGPYSNPYSYETQALSVKQYATGYIAARDQQTKNVLSTQDAK